MVTPDTGIIAKIRKLLKLAQDQGATEAEAALALERANELLLRHNLNIDSLGPEESRQEEQVEQDGVKLGQRRSWQHRLLAYIARHNLCTPLYDGPRVLIVGRPTNIAVSRAMYDWIAPQLVSICDREWREFDAEQRERIGDEGEHDTGYCPNCQEWHQWKRPGRPCSYCCTKLTNSARVHGRTWKSSFMAGAVDRLYYRLKEQREAQKKQADTGRQTSALVVMTDAENNAYISRHIGRVRATRRSNGGNHYEAYNQGQAGANRVSLTSGNLARNTGPLALGSGR